MPKILFVSDMTVSSSIRQEMLAKELWKRGWECYLISQNEAREDVLKSDWNYVHFIRPTLATIDLIRAAVRYPLKLVVDIDDDFSTIPAHHVAYGYLGSGNPQSLAATFEGLSLAHYATVSTPELQKRYEEYIQIHPTVIPNGWSLDHPWHKQEKNDCFTIGWAGTITHRMDFKLCQSAIVEFLRKHKDARVLIGNDSEIYKLFQNVPENQKKYLPMVPYHDYPALVSLFDVLLAPLRDDHFNRAKSDIKLVDAGAAMIPWIASPLPMYQDWQMGGMFARSPEDWLHALETLYAHPEEAHALGVLGRKKVLEEREASILCDLWLSRLP